MADLPNKDEIIARAQRAERALEEIDPYIRAVEAYYLEKLIGVTGWKAWWRGDRRRAEASARIVAVREVRGAVVKVIQAGQLAAQPVRRVGV